MRSMKQRHWREPQVRKVARARGGSLRAGRKVARARVGSLRAGGA